MLSLTPQKRALLGACEPQTKPCPVSPPVAPPAEQDGSGPTAAAEAVETAAPPPALDADNLAGGQIVPEVNDSPVAIDPSVAATAEGGEAPVASSERTCLVTVGRRAHHRDAGGDHGYCTYGVAGGRRHGGGADSC